LRFEVLLPGEARRPAFVRAGDEVALRVHDAHHEEQIRRQQFACGQVGQYLGRTIVLVGGLHDLQRQVDLAQRAHHLRFVGLAQFVGGERDGAARVGALDADQVEGRAPEPGQQQHREERKQDERFGGPTEPTLQASTHAPPGLGRRRRRP
jgi:hypothetical protein